MKYKWKYACSINLFSICGSFIWTSQLFPRQRHHSSFYHIYLYIVKICTFQLHVHWLHILICMMLPLVFLTCSWERNYILIHSRDIQWQGPEIRTREALQHHTPLYLKCCLSNNANPIFSHIPRAMPEILTGVVTLRKVDNIVIKHDLKSTKICIIKFIHVHHQYS